MCIILIWKEHEKPTIRSVPDFTSLSLLHSTCCWSFSGDWCVWFPCCSPSPLLIADSDRHWKNVQRFTVYNDNIDVHLMMSLCWILLSKWCFIASSFGGNTEFLHDDGIPSCLQLPDLQDFWRYSCCFVLFMWNLIASAWCKVFLCVFSTSKIWAEVRNPWRCSKWNKSLTPVNKRNCFEFGYKVTSSVMNVRGDDWWVPNSGFLCQFYSFLFVWSMRLRK